MARPIKTANKNREVTEFLRDFHLGPFRAPLRNVYAIGLMTQQIAFEPFLEHRVSFHEQVEDCRR